MSKGFLCLFVTVFIGLDMFSLILFGVLMGIAFAAPPGIVMAETFRRGVSRGFPAALSVQLGSLIGDATWCLLALAGAAVLVQNPLTQRVLGVVSVLFLMSLAITGILAELRALNRGVTSSPARLVTTSKPSRGSAFITGILLSLTNPWAIGFWLSLGGTLASYGAMESGSAMALFFTSFFATCLMYALAMALLIGVTRKAIPATFGKWVSIACSAIIGILGLGVAYQVLELFLKG